MRIVLDTSTLLFWTLDPTSLSQLLAVDEDTWVASVELNWQHNDPADRVIVATAQMLNAPLVASDGVIRAFYPQSVW